MKGWHNKHQVPGPDEPCSNGERSTEQLIQHLERKTKCVYHHYMSNYLKLYLCKDSGDYLEINARHYGFMVYATLNANNPMITRWNFLLTDWLVRTRFKKI